MKRQIALLLTLLGLTASGATNTTPIHNGRLVDDLNGGGFSITNLNNLVLTGSFSGAISHALSADSATVATYATNAGNAATAGSATTATAARSATNFWGVLGNTNLPNPLDLTYGQGGTLPFSAIGQNGAALGQVPSWDGFGWVPTDQTGGGTATNIPGVTNIYWVSANAQPAGNKGGQTDPFDGSTQVKFDALLSWLRLTNSARTIHLMDGIFDTAGVYGGVSFGSPLLSYTKFLGQGYGRTQIRLAPGANRTNATILGTAFEQNNNVHGGKVTNVEVAGITFNGNGTNAGVVADRVHGVALVGKDCWIHDCEFINFFGNKAANAESFCASIVGMEQHIETNILADANAVIENCVFRDFLGDYGNGPGVYECNGFRISHNVIIQPVRTNSVLYDPIMHGINVAGDCNGLIEGNTIYGASDGIYTDGEWAGWLGNTNITVIGNHFVDVVIGWNLAPYHTPPYVAPNLGWRFIADDVKVARYANHSTAFEGRGFQLYGPIYDTEVSFCRFDGPDSLGTNWWAGYVGGDPSPGTVRISHCVWNDGTVWGTNCFGIGIESSVTNLQFEANYTPQGKLADNMGGAYVGRQTNISHSIVLKGGIMDILPAESAAGPWTNSTGLKLWNSNDCALFVMGTNGVKKQVFP